MKEIGADTSWPWRRLSNLGSGPRRTPVAFPCPATSPLTLRWGHRVPRSRWMGWGRGCPPCTCLPCPLHPPPLQERARGQASPTGASVETSRTPPDRLATFSLWPLSRGGRPPATSHPHLPAEKSLAPRDAGTAGRATRRRAPAPAAPAAAPARAPRPRETTNALRPFDSAKRASRACAERSLSDSGVQEGGAWKTVRPRTTEGGRLPGPRARHSRAVTGRDGSESGTGAPGRGRGHSQNGCACSEAGSERQTVFPIAHRPASGLRQVRPTGQSQREGGPGASTRPAMPSL